MSDMLSIIQIRAHVDFLSLIGSNHNFISVCYIALNFKLSKVGHMLLRNVWVHLGILHTLMVNLRSGPP